jgi:putative ABC transport system ATP-binding protein
MAEAGLRKAERAERARELLTYVGLSHRERHRPPELSGGEQQRVAIARAIAKRPSALLCDEPTGALDLATGVVVLEAIARVNAELGTTTILITHNVSIASMADVVVRLADGHVASIERNHEKRNPRELEW